MRARLSRLVGGMLALVATAASAQAATVTLFASNVYDQLYGLTSDATALYVTGSTKGFRDFGGNPADGVVGRIPLSTGVLATLYASGNYATVSGHVSPFQITTDRKGNLYWADPDAGPGTGAAFLHGTATGGTSTQVFGICCGAGVLPGDGTGLALSGGVLYFADSTGGRIGSGPSGSSATQIGPTRYTPDFPTESWAQIAVAGGIIYIADSGENRGVDGSGHQIIADQSASLKPGVRSITTDGTSGFVDLSVGKIPRPAGIVAVGPSLYVTSGKTIWRIRRSTGAIARYVSDPRFLDLQGITYVNGAFYVADSQTKYGAFVNGIATATVEKPGVIWKVVP